MKSHRQKFTLLVFLLPLIFSQVFSSEVKPLESVVNKYEAIIENLEESFDQGSNSVKMIAKKEISTNKQILIIPTANVMSSEEEYQFKQYFSKSSKEKLIGRLLIERFITNESYFYEYISTLPQSDDLNDYHHFSEENKREFNRRSLNKHSFTDRKEEYEILVRKIPSNVISSNIGNTHFAFESYSI